MRFTIQIEQVEDFCADTAIAVALLAWRGGGTRAGTPGAHFPIRLHAMRRVSRMRDRDSKRVRGSGRRWARLVRKHALWKFSKVSALVYLPCKMRNTDFQSVYLAKEAYKHHQKRPTLPTCKPVLHPLLNPTPNPTHTRGCGGLGVVNTRSWEFRQELGTRR